LTLLNESGLINNKLLALDGTRIKANASLGSNLPYEKIEADIQKKYKKFRKKTSKRIFSKALKIQGMRFQKN